MFELDGFQHRSYRIQYGDIVWLNDVYVQELFNISLKDLPLGEKMKPGFVCIKKTKRKHWWQFWKKKYTGARLMYVEKGELI